MLRFSLAALLLSGVALPAHAGLAPAHCADVAMTALGKPAIRLDALILAQAVVPAQPAPEGQTEEQRLALQLAEMLQACSYDGTPLTVTGKQLGGPGADGQEVVSEIMRFTGLPQNFVVIEGEVPNAAAMMALDENDMPVRLIAYNPAFMDDVRAATAQNNWAPISIMAHEIGHHLSGHTLVPGGSQPPIELEADRFSGFVLEKMGASLDDTTKAIATLIPEEGSASHPGRATRLGAVTSGWTDACRLGGKAEADCAAGAEPAAAAPEVVAEAPAPKTVPAAPAPAHAAPEGAGEGGALPVIEGAQPEARQVGGVVPVADWLKGKSLPEVEALMIELMGKMGDPAVDQDALLRQLEEVNVAAATLNGMTVVDAAPQLDARVAEPDAIPAPDPAGIPRKTDRFVWDAFGIIAPEVKAALEKQAYDAAAATGVEVVTLLTNNLHGMSGDAYAATMLRQMRVGKMDVGNGAVLVVAPNEQQVGVAVGPGIALGFGAEGMEQLRGYLTSFLGSLMDGANPSAKMISESLGWAADRVIRDTHNLDWQVRFADVAAMEAAFAAYEADRKAKGESYDPLKNPTFNRLVRQTLTVTDLTPKDDPEAGRFVLEPSERLYGPGLLAQMPDGRKLVVYASDLVRALMTAPLEEGRSYSVVMRETGLTLDVHSFALVSYDALTSK